jgi:hypothetical protein
MVDRTETRRLEEFGAGFEKVIDGWARQAVRVAPMVAAPTPPQVLSRMRDALLRLVGKIMGFLGRLVDLIPVETGPLGEALGTLLDSVVDVANGMIEDVAGFAGDAAAAALGAALGVIELIKKTIYLVTDQIAKRLPGEPLTDLIHLHLDMLNNLLGNMAELVSPKTGQMARRFRADMYEQVAMVRVAQGAIPPRQAEPEEG